MKLRLFVLIALPVTVAIVYIERLFRGMAHAFVLAAYAARDEFECGCRLWRQGR